MHRRAWYLSHVRVENEEMVDRCQQKVHRMATKWSQNSQDNFPSFHREQKGKRKVLDLLCPIWSTLLVTRLQVVGNCVYKQSDNKKERNFFSRDGKSNRQASMYARGFTKFKITVACGLKFHWYLRTLSLKFQKSRTKTEAKLRQPTGQRQENFSFCPSLLKF